MGGGGGIEELGRDFFHGFPFLFRLPHNTPLNRLFLKAESGAKRYTKVNFFRNIPLKCVAGNKGTRNKVNLLRKVQLS